MIHRLIESKTRSRAHDHNVLLEDRRWTAKAIDSEAQGIAPSEATQLYIEPPILLVYFGGRLAEAGADVSFLVRDGRKQKLDAEGLRIESPYGDAHLQVKAIVAGDVTPDFDFVILTCKAYDLSDAVDTIAGAVGPQTTVLPLLNGIAHMAVLNVRFGQNRVLGGSAKIQANVAAGGTVRQLNDWRYLTIGEQNGTMSKRVEVLSELFSTAKGVSWRAFRTSCKGCGRSSFISPLPRR